MFQSGPPPTQLKTTTEILLLVRMQIRRLRVSLSIDSKDT